MALNMGFGGITVAAYAEQFLSSLIKSAGMGMKASCEKVHNFLLSLNKDAICA